MADDDTTGIKAAERGADPQHRGSAPAAQPKISSTLIVGSALRETSGNQYFQHLLGYRVCNLRIRAF